MFREVPLPHGIAGQLFLHSMPGRLEPFDEAKKTIVASGVRQVVCLTPPDEIEEKSPDYAKAIRAGVPWRHVTHPIPDFGVPENAESFRKVVESTASALKQGDNVLVHCAAGIGRTGTFAVALLCRLGIPLHEARRIVRNAGSSAESLAQVDFLQTVCK